jgi:hypothetical protein
MQFVSATYRQEQKSQERMNLHTSGGLSHQTKVMSALPSAERGGKYGFLGLSFCPSIDNVQKPNVGAVIV